MIPSSVLGLLETFLYSSYVDMLAIVLRIKVGIIELSEDTRISVNFYSFSRFYEADVKLIINTLFELWSVTQRTVLMRNWRNLCLFVSRAV